MPKPFFKNSRNRWYVEIDGKQHNLGPDEESANELYHELMVAHAADDFLRRFPSRSLGSY